MSHANFNVSLKLILVNSKKQILGLKVPTTSYFAGFYDLPGGRINVNELHYDFVKTLKREIKEEIGNLKIKISWEHDGYEWLEVNKKNVDKYFFKNYLAGVKQYLNLHN